MLKSIVQQQLALFFSVCLEIQHQLNSYTAGKIKSVSVLLIVRTLASGKH